MRHASAGDTDWECERSQTGRAFPTRTVSLTIFPHEALRQSQHRLEVVSQVKVELARYKNQKATPQWAIDLLASQRTKRYRAWRRTTRHKCYQGCGFTDGKWVIETNDDTLTPEDAASDYKGLMVIERCFQTLKTTQLKLEPVYTSAVTSHRSPCQNLRDGVDYRAGFRTHL